MRPNINAIVQLINYFATQSHFNEIGKLHLLKYVYFADRYHLRKYGRLITNDTYFAMSYGPVASTTKNIIEFRHPDANGYARQYLQPVDRNSVRSIAPVDYDMFSETDREAMRAAKALSVKIRDPVAYTHLFPEWKKHEARMTSEKSRVKMDLLDFFNKAPGKVEYCHVEFELLALNRECFIEDRETLACFFNESNGN